MSYDVYIYHRDVAALAAGPGELDEYEYPRIEPADLHRFLDRVIRYGYREEQAAGRVRGFMKVVDGCPIQVSVFETEIAFTVPYWRGNEAALFTALQDAAELSDSETTVCYDPQNDEWIE